VVFLSIEYISIIIQCIGIVKKKMPLYPDTDTAAKVKNRNYLCSQRALWGALGLPEGCPGHFPGRNGALDGSLPFVLVVVTPLLPHH